MSDCTTNKDVHLLIKWTEENAWDVISPSEAGLSTVELENPAIIVGETRDICFKGSVYGAKILEVGPMRQMNKKCTQLINEFKEKEEANVAISRKRVPVPNKRFLQSDDDSDDDHTNCINLPKKVRPEKQENLLNKLKKKIVTGNHPCCASKQLLENANEKIASLEKENKELKSELEGHRTLKNVIDDVRKLQLQAKSVLKYSERCANSLTSNTCDEEQFTQSNPASSISVPSNLIELIPETAVFIEKRKLENIKADAAGDGRKLARNLLISLFEPSELANHSVTGRSSNAFKGAPKPPVDQARLSAILRYVSNETNTDIGKVRASIANKIKEITYSYSKQEGNA